MFSTSYFIKNFDQNIYNQNKFVFTDGVEGILEQSDGKWFFDLSFYIVGDFYLPINSLICNFISPFGIVENIPVNRDYAKITPDYATWKEKTLCFESKFFIDIKNNDFFKQKLFKKEIEYFFTFDVDDKVINNIEIAATQDVFEGFIHEFNCSKISTKMIYTNTIETYDDESDVFDIKKFYLNSYGGCQFDGNRVNFEYVDPNKNKLYPIKDLIRITCNETIEIEKYVIKIVYSMENQPKKYLEIVNEKKSYFGKEITLSIDSFTHFDVEKMEISLSDCGIKGFYSPIKTWGTIQVYLQIKEDFENKTIIFNKNFSFGNQNDYSKSDPLIEKVFINDLNKFERIIF